MFSRSYKRHGSYDVAEIGHLLRELERLFAQLGRSAASDAKHARTAIPDALSETWSDLSDRVGTALQDRAHLVQGASRAGTLAWQRFEREVTDRPLVALAIAAGIGFLIGAINRR
jgi:ElaB/YqjD/DUF883 family membrane-anchored ribosome-binding protein